MRRSPDPLLQKMTRGADRLPAAPKQLSYSANQQLLVAPGLTLHGFPE